MTPENEPLRHPVEAFRTQLDVLDPRVYADGLVALYREYLFYEPLDRVGHFVCSAVFMRGAAPGLLPRAYMRGAALGLTTTVGFPTEKQAEALKYAIHDQEVTRYRTDTDPAVLMRKRESLLSYGAIGLGKAVQYRPTIVRLSEELYDTPQLRKMLQNGFGFAHYITRDAGVYEGMDFSHDAGRIEADAAFVALFGMTRISNLLHTSDGDEPQL